MAIVFGLQSCTKTPLDPADCLEVRSTVVLTSLNS